MEPWMDYLRITLLSAEEFERWKDQIPFLKKNWWTMTPAVRMRYYFRCRDINEYQVMFVNIEGELITMGLSVFSKADLRPVLKCQESNTCWNVGSSFSFGNLSFTVLSTDTAIADDVIGESEFSRDTNDYEKSTAKKILEEWLAKARMQR